jgi:hypothetical protein
MDNFDITTNPDVTWQRANHLRRDRHDDGETEVNSTMLAGSYPVRLRP